MGRAPRRRQGGLPETHPGVGRKRGHPPPVAGRCPRTRPCFQKGCHESKTRDDADQITLSRQCRVNFVGETRGCGRARREAPSCLGEAFPMPLHPALAKAPAKTASSKREEPPPQPSPKPPSPPARSPPADPPRRGRDRPLLRRRRRRSARSLRGEHALRRNHERSPSPSEGAESRSPPPLREKRQTGRLTSGSGFRRHGGGERGKAVPKAKPLKMAAARNPIGPGHIADRTRSPHRTRLTAGRAAFKSATPASVTPV